VTSRVIIIRKRFVSSLRPRRFDADRVAAIGLSARARVSTILFNKVTKDAVFRVLFSLSTIVWLAVQFKRDVSVSSKAHILRVFFPVLMHRIIAR